MTGINAEALRQYAKDYDQRILLLQGGGALGSYQAGVYEGLDEAGILPDWVSGISIGALNAAIIAGNPPQHRVAKLKAFWNQICAQPWLPGIPTDPWHNSDKWPPAFRSWVNGFEATRAILEGQRGFYTPRTVFGSGPTQASFYDTTPLRATLENLCDFDRINHAESIRVSLGAVNVRTGNFAYFDNTQQKLGPEHFMASGALPPGFPAVEVDGEFYWDGGVVSNTPLFQVLTEQKHHNSLVFQVDLWSAQGELPNDLMEVANRQKDIQYSSRTRMVTDMMRKQIEMRKALQDVLALVPAELHNDPKFQEATSWASGAKHNVVHLIYANKPYEGGNKDYQFGLITMNEHWASGLGDIRHTFEHPQLLALPPDDEAFTTHDIHRGANGDD